MASDKTKVDLPRDYKIPELRPYTTLDEKYGNLQSGHYFADKEDVVADKAKELAGDLLFGEDSENTNLLTGAVPFADAAIKASEGKRPGLLDVAGDLKIPMLAMSVPFIRRYHITNPENVYSIARKGLKADNKSGGAKAVYTSVSPEVARMNRDGDVVLEVRMPKDKYKTSNRFTEDPAREEVANHPRINQWGEEESIETAGKEYKSVMRGGRNDYFAEDIPPEFLSIKSIDGNAEDVEKAWKRGMDDRKRDVRAKNKETTSQLSVDERKLAEENNLKNKIYSIANDESIPLQERMDKVSALYEEIRNKYPWMYERLTKGY